MRVVFDTNVFISALMIPGGNAEKALLRVIEGVDELITSKQIINETLSVLARKFGRDQDALARVAMHLAEIAQQVIQPPETVKVLTHEGDNRVVECAVAGKAAAVVTGDKRMLDLREYHGIEIISLREYLSR